ncbi:MAG: SAM-dependent methyltransferase, partial [Saprospiraceae bacterium]|nr:SAM-dependent methyltransferase [Saprospiraceae bacterium]
ATTEHPSIASMAFWRAYSFNTFIYLRNILIKPPFIMYYLTFLLPKLQHQLENVGFKVEIKDDLFTPPFQSLKLVIATKK